MHERPEEDVILTEFRKECSVRRTVKVLEAKQKRIQDDLRQMIQHIALLVPYAGASQTGTTEFHADLLKEALLRFGDDAFAQLVLQMLQELK